MREDAKTEAINRKTVKPKQSRNTTSSEAIDAESIASLVIEKISGDFSRFDREITTLSESFLTFQSIVEDNFQQMLRKIESSLCRSGGSSTDQPLIGYVHNIDDQQDEIRRHYKRHVGTQTDPAENHIISEAIIFANQATTFMIEVSFHLNLQILYLPDKSLPYESYSNKIQGPNIRDGVLPEVATEAEAPVHVQEDNIPSNQTTNSGDEVNCRLTLQTTH